MNEHSKQVRLVGLLALSSVAIYLCWLMLRPFITVLEWAAVLVIVFYPLHKQLARRIHRRGLCALLSVTLVIVVVVLPLGFLAIALTNELAGVARSLPANVTQLSEGPLGRVAGWLQTYVPWDSERSRAFFAAQLEAAGSALLGQSLDLVGNLIGIVAKAFFVVITMYYLFRDSDKIEQALVNVLPFNRDQNEAILGRIKQVLNASVHGVLSIALLQGLLGGLAFWVLGVPSPILWAVLLAFVCMIPIAGSFMVWLPASVYLLLAGHVSKAVVLVVWGLLVVSTVDNFLRPKLITNETKLHELLVFFAVLGGMSVFGLLGIVLGPVVLAVALGILDIFKVDLENERRPPVRAASVHSISLSASGSN